MRGENLPDKWKHARVVGRAALQPFRRATWTYPRPRNRSMRIDSRDLSRDFDAMLTAERANS